MISYKNTSSMIAIIIVMIIGFGSQESQSQSIKGESNQTINETQIEGEVIARIGEVVITDVDLQKKIDEIPTYAQKNFLTREGKMKLLERLVRTKLLLKAAEAADYASRPDIQEKINDARTRILTSEYFKNELSTPDGPDENQLKKYYEEHKMDYQTEAQVDVSHILVASEKIAKDIYNQIKSGEITFENAVEKFSIDKQSIVEDGNIGTVRKGGFIKGIGRSNAFDEEVFSLEPGDITRPIKSRRGWHLFRVNEFQPEGFLTFEEVKENIADQLLISEEQINAEYELNPDKYRQRRRAKIRHIQLDTLEDAQQVYTKLEKGADFTQLVNSDSKDEASKRQEGSLGYLYEDGYIRGIGKDADFETIVFALDEGEYSNPVKSKNGWHIVLVEEKFESDLKPLDEVRTQIKNKLIREMKQNAIDSKFNSLKQKFNAEIYEDKISGS